MRFSETRALRLRGHLEYSVWRHVDGVDRLVERTGGDNLVVNAGLARLAANLAAGTGIAVAQIGVGTNGTAPTTADIGLTSGVLVDIVSVEWATPLTVAAIWDVPRGTATDLSIMEFGLFLSDSTMIARKVRSIPIVKGADIRVAGTWTLQFD